jgi:hypothetical protein
MLSKERKEEGSARKKYNPNLIYLFNLANKASINFSHDKDRIKDMMIRAYDRYINDIDGKVLILRHKYEQNKTCIIPYIHRSHDMYIKKVKSRLKPLRNVQLNGVFLTITSNPNVCMSYKDMHSRLSKAWNRLNSYIKYKYGNIPYLKVLELTSSGLLHMHIVFIGIKYLLDQKVLSKLLDKYGVGYVTYVSYVQRGGNAMKYVMKYLTKTVNLNSLKTNSKSLELHHDLMAISTALRARLYGISHNLMPISKPKKDTIVEWEYVMSYIDKRLGYGILPMNYIEYIYYS